MMRRYRWLVFLLLLPLFLIDGGQPAPAQVFPTHQAPVRFPRGAIFPIGQYPATATASPLTGFYTSFWKLADLADSIGGLTLTNSATPVTFSAGKIGNAGDFVAASSEYLSRANVTFTGPSFTVALWFKTVSAAGPYFLSWNLQAAGNVNLGIGIFIPGKVAFYTKQNPVSEGDAAESVSTYNDGTWHLAVAYHDSGTGNNVLIVDNGAPVTHAGTTNVASTSTTLTLGCYSGVSVFLSGSLDAVGIADNKIPTAAQLTAMWNAGVGAEPPF